MTRKDYELIAGALKAVLNAVDSPQRLGAALAVRELAHRLADENPRFDRARFLAACAIDPA